MIAVREATGDEIVALRMAVLRPDQPVVAAEYDRSPETRHVAAYDDDVLVGCATVFPSGYDGEPGAWQLRGMAVVPGLQGRGVGGLVLRKAIEIARSADAALLWANARVTALGFYQRLGFEVVGEEFTYGPASLPHKKIVMHLTGAHHS